MKKIIVFICLSLMTFSADAQKGSFKIAYFDMDSLVAVMPDVKTAEDSAQKYLAALEEKELDLNAELQRKTATLDKLMEKDGNIDAKKVLTDEIAEYQKRISEFQQAAQDEYEMMHEKLLAPAFEKINNAAKKVAIEKGYAFVLDSSKSAAIVIYAGESYNIFNDMCKELGIPKR